MTHGAPGRGGRYATITGPGSAAVVGMRREAPRSAPRHDHGSCVPRRLQATDVRPHASLTSFTRTGPQGTPPFLLADDGHGHGRAGGTTSRRAVMPCRRVHGRTVVPCGRVPFRA